MISHADPFFGHSIGTDKRPWRHNSADYSDQGFCGLGNYAHVQSRRKPRVVMPSHHGESVRPAETRRSKEIRE